MNVLIKIEPIQATDHLIERCGDEQFRRRKDKKAVTPVKVEDMIVQEPGKYAGDNYDQKKVEENWIILAGSRNRVIGKRTAVGSFLCLYLLLKMSKSASRNFH